MTTLAPAPARDKAPVRLPAPAPAPGPGPERRSLAGPWRTCLAVAVGVALASLSLAPLFQDATWVLQPLIMVLAITACGWALVTLRVPAVLVPLGQCFVGLVLLVQAFTQGTPRSPLPSGPALDQLHVVLQDGMDDVANYSAPAPVTPGLVALCSLGIGLVTILAFAFAVSLRAPVLAGGPLVALYAVPAGVVQDGALWWGFVLAAIGWLVIVTADSRLRLAAWGQVLPRSDAPVDLQTRTSLLGPAVRVGVPALALALLLPALVPGLTDALLGPRGPGGSGTGGSGAGAVSLDPMVSLRRDLQQSATQVVFTYHTSDPDPQYLRAVTLTDFDGVNWHPQVFSSQTAPPLAQAQLRSGGFDPAVATTAQTYVMQDAKLSTPYLPLPAPVSAVTIPGDWHYDAGSGTVFSSSTTTLGKTWTAQALVMSPTAEQLQDAPTAIPDGVEHSTNLPVPLPAELTDTAAAVTAGQTTEYGRAMALQHYFRTQFSYSTAVSGDGSTDALLTFLRDKIGYCQQFAATMALMARSLGIPSRVGVGFTSGTQDGAGDYVVTTKDAHAWPELWFGGIGWVRFEPTPRSDTGGTVTVPSWAQGGITSSPTTSAPGSGVGGSSGESGNSFKMRALDHRHDVVGADPGIDVPATPAATSSDPLREAALLVLLVVALIVAAVPAAVRLIRRRRRRRTGPDRALAEQVWAEVRDTVRDLGGQWADADTPRQASARLSGNGRLEAPAAAALGRLASDTENARYAREPGALDRRRVQADLRTSLRALQARASAAERWRARLLPASVLRPGGVRTA
jgi:transglutaminase-like putative cysteine protease